MLVFADIFLYLYLFVCQYCCLGAELSVNDMFTSPALTQSRGMCLYLVFVFAFVFVFVFVFEFVFETI